MEDRPRCPECGETHRGPTCREHGDGPALRLVPLGEAELDGVVDPGVTTRLIREFKGPTHQDLLDDEAEIELLPGRVRDVLRAIEEGDLRGASERLDAAIGALLPGPGFGRRDEWRQLAPVLLALFLILSSATLLLVL